MDVVLHLVEIAVDVEELSRLTVDPGTCRLTVLDVGLSSLGLDPDDLRTERPRQYRVQVPPRLPKDLWFGPRAAVTSLGRTGLMAEVEAR